MKQVMTLLLLCMAVFGFAQQNEGLKPIPAKVQTYLNQGETFVKVNPFLETINPDRMDIPTEVRQSGWGLVPNLNKLVSLEKEQPEFLEMHVPRLKGAELVLLLYKVNIVTPDFQIIQSDGKIIYDVPGVHYRGIIKGNTNSLVGVSIFRDQIIAVISNDEGNWNLGPLEEATDKQIHVCYNDKDIAAYHNFSCGMEDDMTPADTHPVEQNGGRGLNDCVRIWWEVDHDIVLNKGSVANATAYITAMAAQVYIMYANESINMATSVINVWATPDPYTGNNSSARLASFEALNGTLNGDLAHYVDLNNYGGIAHWFDGVCNPNYDDNMCYSGIATTYNNVPTYSWTIMVCTHEMGHLIGSRHTHACVWNGNNTAIDGCSGFTEGGCALPPQPPGGGTIMSYCHQNVGINFNLGFGPQPGNVIRTRVTNAACLTPCGAAPCTFNINCPPATTVQCGANPLPASSGNATVQITAGACSPTISYTDNNAGLTLCNGTGFFIRTFSATDGNSTKTCSQTITKVDNTPPVISGTSNNVTINCNSPVPAAPILSATDNCGPATLNMVETTSGANCGYIITRTWTATDNCNNTSTRQQIVTVTDTSPPVAKCRVGHEVFLNANGEATIFAGDIDDGSSDACSAITLAISPTLVTCANIGNTPVTLIVTDACNNVASCNAIVKVTDNLFPQVSCLDLDIYLDESGNPVTIDPSDLDGGITDNCTVVQIDLSQSVFDCDDLGKTTVKVTARDQSNNSSECQSTIRVYDLIPPMFSYFPPDVTVYCTEENAFEVPEATDNCGLVSLGMTDEQQILPGGPTNSYLVVRSWWAVDQSGNEVTGIQRVAVFTEGEMVTICNDDIKTAPSKAPVKVSWDAPKVDDICLGGFAMTQMEGPPSGSYFNPASTTRITYGYEDAWGSRYECAFDVTVPGINTDYQVVIQQADADCGDHMIGRCAITDVTGSFNASLYLTPKGSLNETVYHLNGPSSLEMYADGTARLTASWNNPTNAEGWDGTIWFFHRRSYAGWVNAGGKANVKNGGNPADWTYFELDANRSELVGTGGNDGDTISVQQSPNYAKNGLQIGNRANTLTAGDGGWCAIATLNNQGQYTARGYISFMSNCAATNLIKNAGEVISLNGGTYSAAWSNGSNNVLMGDAAPGNHNVNVTNANGQVQNHIFTLAAPTGCTLLWENHCRESNVAVGAGASQISTYQNGTADRAVDGNTDGDFANGSVTSTLAGWQNYWSANLGQNYPVESVRIWPRTDIGNSGLEPFYVFVSANPIPDLAPELLLRTAGIRAIRHEGPMQEAWRMPANMVGQYIKVQLEAEGRLMMAEVEALVCQKDRLNAVPGAPTWQYAPGNSLGGPSTNIDVLTVWPNPTADELNLYISQSKVAPTSVTIMSMTGNQIYRNDLSGSREHQLRIPVGDWLTGMYAITVSGPDGIRTQMVQVTR